MSRAVLHGGDVRAVLAGLPERSVQMVCTSPPYFGLRDYGTASWEGGLPDCDHKQNHGVQGATGQRADRTFTAQAVYRAECGRCGATRTDQQLGLERTPEEYVAAMVAVFREVRRVLRDDGTVWLNLGDSYAGSGKGGNPEGSPWAGFVGNKQREASAKASAPIVPVNCKPKDLIGIPWLVAFALRQPYEVAAIREHTDRAWLAALIDGEGCITTTVAQPTTGINESYAVVIQIRMSDRQCLDRVVAVTGMSRVQDEALPPSMTGTGQRPVYCWKIAGENAATVLAEVYPYLHIKRGQAVAAWNLQRLKDGVTTKRGVPVPEANMEQRRTLHRAIRALNQREPVDIPGWCVEPSVAIEPGWYIRSDVIWGKSNPMPESVTDRPTKAHEYLFLLTKSERYYYDAEAIAEPGVEPERQRLDRIGGANGHTVRHSEGGMIGASATRNARSVWTIATQPYAGAHFATMPEELARRCILAGSSAKACETCGAPWERQLERTPMVLRRSERTHELGRTRSSGTMLEPPTAVTVGWQPTCDCEANTGAASSVVLDPFAGSGTTAAVAVGHGRSAIYVDLNPAYLELARQRIGPLLCDDAPEPTVEVA